MAVREGRKAPATWMIAERNRSGYWTGGEKREVARRHGSRPDRSRVGTNTGVTSHNSLQTRIEPFQLKTVLPPEYRLYPSHVTYENENLNQRGF